VLLSALLASCAAPPPPAPPPPPPPPSAGETLFLAQQWPEALVQFEHDYETALAEDDRRLALYGLSCTQLALASSDEQLAQAMANLERWIEEHEKNPGDINPRLLVVAFKAQGERLHVKSQELSRLVKRKNGVIASQRKKITEMADTVDNLQKQLEELEAIDETLQEKRKAL
jgi:hypothetical protein